MMGLRGWLVSGSAVWSGVGIALCALGEFLLGSATSGSVSGARGPIGG